MPPDFESETALMVLAGCHAAEAEHLIQELSTASGKEISPHQVSALARMMAIIDQGSISETAVHSIARHQLEGAMQTIGLRITMLERRMPMHAALPRLQEIRDAYALLHEARIAALLKDIPSTSKITPNTDGSRTSSS